VGCADLLLANQSQPLQAPTGLHLTAHRETELPCLT
jgi:hypothetical protein